MDEIKKTEGDENEEIISLNPQGYVTLPFPESQFKDFVKGLLGKPQSISGVISGVFEINKGDIQHLHSLMNQRVSQQNDAVLVQFITTVVFSDNTSIVFSTIEEVLTFNELTPIVSQEIHFTFTYLIKFQDKDVPERQEIDISIIGGRKRGEELDRLLLDKEFETRVSRYSLEDKYLQGFIQYTIKHTARSWGVDIQSLLVKFFSGKIILEDKWRVFLRRIGDFVELFLFLIFAAVGVTTAVLFRENEKNNIKEALNEKFSNTDVESLNNLKDLLEYGLSQINTLSVWPIVIIVASLVGAMILFNLTNIISLYGKTSFILLTSETQKEKEEDEREYRRSYLKFIGFTISSIICSLLANYLFLLFSDSL